MSNIASSSTNINAPIATSNGSPLVFSSSANQNQASEADHKPMEHPWTPKSSVPETYGSEYIEIAKRAALDEAWERAAMYLQDVSCNATEERRQQLLAANKEAENPVESIRKFDQLQTSNNSKATTAQATGFTDVPEGLPDFRIAGTGYHENGEKVFQTVAAFALRFEVVVQAYGYRMDDSWERLLPLTLVATDLSWFCACLKGRGLTWDQAVGELSREYDDETRYIERKTSVFEMRQQQGQSVPEYGEQFKQAMLLGEYPDSTVMGHFFVSTLLRHEQDRIYDIYIASGKLHPFTVQYACSLGRRRAERAAGSLASPTSQPKPKAKTCVFHPHAKSHSTHECLNHSQKPSKKAPRPAPYPKHTKRVQRQDSQSSTHCRPESPAQGKGPARGKNTERYTYPDPWSPDHDDHESETATRASQEAEEPVITYSVPYPTARRTGGPLPVRSTSPRATARRTGGPLPVRVSPHYPTATRTGEEYVKIESDDLGKYGAAKAQTMNGPKVLMDTLYLVLFRLGRQQNKELDVPVCAIVRAIGLAD
ncbi:hypothetical protein DFQ28_011693 [Apophysomyces sp. BC1034]|nr:hypothetical protein DFQ30_011266 [Apophysomyces sp. BC1015]KAG0177806.1 hypothetical protein DFQ29_004317 [Apophysomyces sp. BC1021]KAG0191508.1 hypothetical protein DFQ28_011693 [Apophysomyces sp. BC1034]